MSTVSCPRALRQLWLYRRSFAACYVGHFDAAGNWQLESTHTSADDAAARVHWLNGGGQHHVDTQFTSAETEISQLHRQVEQLTADLQKWTKQAQRQTRRLHDLERRRHR